MAPPLNTTPDRTGRSHITRRTPRLVIGAMAAIIVAGLLLARFGACPWSPVCGPLLADDVVQGRLDTALPAPQGALVVEQSFTPRHNGLTAVELLLARYDGQAPADAHLDVALWDDAGVEVAATSLPAAALSNNQSYTLDFAPQPDSAGRRYVLRLRGSEGNPVSAWGYSLEVYSGGELTLDAGALAAPPATAARELRFTTRYALTGGGALAAAVAPLGREWPLLLVAALLLPLPGVWLLLLFRPRRWGRAVWAGAALALGVAVWPLLWLWLSLAGGRWSAATLWAVVVLGWLAVAALALWRRAASRRHPPATHTSSASEDADSALATRHSPLATPHFFSPRLPRSPAPLLLLTLLAVSVAVRFIAVRDQAFPPWVDSSRHALITAVMVESGRAPDGYAPYLPVQGFPYHFGFHTLSAGLALLTGRPLPDLLLTLGQLLNGLVPLAVFAAGRLATGRRSVGLLAAFLVALPFFFPGYYATWGRMTQLTAMLIMPVLLALTWRLARGWSRLWPLVGVLAAGLFLVHFRVFLFYLPFAALVGAIEVAKLARPPEPIGVSCRSPAAGRGAGAATGHAARRRAAGRHRPAGNDWPVATRLQRLSAGLHHHRLGEGLPGAGRRRRAQRAHGRVLPPALGRFPAAAAGLGGGAVCPAGRRPAGVAGDAGRESKQHVHHPFRAAEFVIEHCDGGGVAMAGRTTDNRGVRILRCGLCYAPPAAGHAARI